MKKAIVMCSFFLAGFFSFAQNLVLNPGFEEHGEISGNGAGSDNLQGNNVKHWLSPTDASPDYFIRGDDYLYNQYGPPQSHDGMAMAGIVVFGGKKEYREYLAGELTQPLVAGNVYEFSYYIAMAGFSGEMISEFGVYFSADRVVDKSISGALKLVPQISTDSTDQPSLNGKWMKMSGTFMAAGGEKYLVIGNFLSDKKTSDKKVNPGVGSPFAYYYFDDISLMLTEDITPDHALPYINEKPVDSLKIAAGKKLVIENVYFETDKSVLKEESFPVLDEIIAALLEQPQLKVEIDGYTDSQGSASHNKTLSEERAKSVAAYFTAHGISSERISTKGFGASRPVAEENDEHGRQKNRRVEFVFSD